MARFKATVNGQVLFTPEEEAEWDAMEMVWAQRHAQPPTPTKEQLLAQLQALQTQIQALE
jgi:hypothetical protein